MSASPIELKNRLPHPDLNPGPARALTPSAQQALWRLWPISSGSAHKATETGI